MRVSTLLKSSVLAVLLAPALLPSHAAGMEHRRFPVSAPLVVLRAGTPWNNLSPGEQEVLQKHRHNWGGYPPERQDRLRDGAQRYLNLPPDKRDKVRRKQEQYREMSPEERKRLREQYRQQKQHR